LIQRLIGYFSLDSSPISIDSRFNMPPRVAPVNALVDADYVLYVHPSEGLNSVLVTPKLIGSNYLAWSRPMQRALVAKNKLKFVDVLWRFLFCMI
jgi:hypothetical protein